MWGMTTYHVSSFFFLKMSFKNSRAIKSICNTLSTGARQVTCFDTKIVFFKEMLCKTYVFVPLLIILVCASCDVTDNNTVGSELRRKDRIYGGAPERQNESPFMVSMQTDDFGDGTWLHRCAGAILNCRWIITAASCVDGITPPSKIRLVAGSANRRRPSALEQAVLAKTIVMHPKYKKATRMNDIALVECSNPWMMSESVDCIELPQRFQETRQGELATMVGWGKRTEDGDLSTRLWKAEMPVWSNENCTTAYANFQNAVVYPSCICVGLAEGRSACLGDGGDPLINGANQIIGIVSWGAAVCTPPFTPNVCTRVSHYIDWIRRVMETQRG